MLRTCGVGAAVKNNRDWVNDDDSDEAGRIIIMGRRMEEEEEEEEEREAEEERGRRRREGPVSGRAGLWARSDGGEEKERPLPRKQEPS